MLELWFWKGETVRQPDNGPSSLGDICNSAWHANQYDLSSREALRIHFSILASIMLTPDCAFTNPFLSCSALWHPQLGYTTEYSCFKKWSKGRKLWNDITLQKYSWLEDAIVLFKLSTRLRARQGTNAELRLWHLRYISSIFIYTLAFLATVRLPTCPKRQPPPRAWGVFKTIFMSNLH